jgi:hypothetical protein
MRFLVCFDQDSRHASERGGMAFDTSWCWGQYDIGCLGAHPEMTGPIPWVYQAFTLLLCSRCRAHIPRPYGHSKTFPNAPHALSPFVSKFADKKATEIMIEAERVDSFLFRAVSIKISTLRGSTCMPGCRSVIPISIL